MKTIAAFLIFLLAGVSARAQRPQGLGADLRAVAENNGALFGILDDGDVKIVRSTNGGVSFDEVLHAVTFPDELHHIAANAHVAIAGGGTLLLRADLDVDATDWTEIDLQGLIFNIAAIAHNGDQSWAVAGDDGVLWISGDHGENWTDQSPPGPTVIADVAWSPANQSWWVAGGDRVHEFDGDTWTSTQIPGVMLTAVASDALGNVLVAGQGGALYLREVSSSEFVAVPGSGSENFTDIVVLGDNDFAVAGDQRGLWRVNSGTAGVLLETRPGHNEVYQIATLDGAVVMAGVAVVLPPVIDALAASNDPVEVTLVPTDAAHNVYYTTDGSEPETGALYEDPFTVTGTVTVQAVSEEDGVFSAAGSMQIEAGELQIFSLEITLDGNTLVITQDTSSVGVTYQLQGTADLGDSESWQDRDDPKSGTGDPLQWIIDPIPAGTQAWRTRVVNP